MGSESDGFESGANVVILERSWYLLDTGAASK